MDQTEIAILVRAEVLKTQGQGKTIAIFNMHLCIFLIYIFGRGRYRNTPNGKKVKSLDLCFYFDYSLILADKDNEEEEVFDEEALLMASMGLPLAFASTSDYRRTVSGKFFWRVEHPFMLEHSFMSI